MEQRSLDISDLAVEDEIEVKKDPFRFLLLPEGSSPEDARRSYIQLAKRWHPDLVDTRSGDNARENAHRKMVLINRAYEEIKSRYKPDEWNRLFGYDFRTVYNEAEHNYTKVMNLEGGGEVTIYSDHNDYFEAGPYLGFDYGPDDDHPWIVDYRHSIPLKHIFAHIEISQRKEINKVLLESFVDCFRLDSEKADQIRKLLSDNRSAESIMKEVGIPSEKEASEGKKIAGCTDSESWTYSLRFRRHLNQIMFLSTEPEWDRDTRSRYDFDRSVKLKLEGNILTLKNYEETIFSEADFYLLLTLAYGRMLK